MQVFLNYQQTARMPLTGLFYEAATPGGKPPIKEPPNAPGKPPVEDPRKPPPEPPRPDRPPIKEPPGKDPEPPVRPPPSKDDPIPENPPIRAYATNILSFGGRKTNLAPSSLPGASSFRKAFPPQFYAFFDPDPDSDSDFAGVTQIASETDDS